jgi:hypothetical protein
MWHARFCQTRASEADFYGANPELPEGGVPDREVGPELRWTFTANAVTIVLDIRSSFAAPTPTGGHALALDGVVASALRVLAALARAPRASQRAVLVSVTAQGARVGDVRVLLHDMLLSSESLAAASQRVVTGVEQLQVRRRRHLLQIRYTLCGLEEVDAQCEGRPCVPAVPVLRYVLKKDTDSGLFSSQRLSQGRAGLLRGASPQRPAHRSPTHPRGGERCAAADGKRTLGAQRPRGNGGRAGRGAAVVRRPPAPAR